MAFYIDSNKTGSSGEIAYLLKKCILHCPKKWTEIVFLCIGVVGDDMSVFEQLKFCGIVFWCFSISSISDDFPALKVF